MEFHEITLADREWMTGYFGAADLNACEFSFATNFIWRHAYQIEVAQIEGCGVCRCRKDGKTVFSYPFGDGDHKKAIKKICNICNIENIKTEFYPIVEEQREELLALFPGEFEIDTDRDDFDYIYSYEKLATLKGKKLHGKRNHIARFKDGGDWSYEPFTASNRDACIELAEVWEKKRAEKWNDAMTQEMVALREALAHFDELGLSGGVLRKNGNIVAFTIGEALNSDTFVVHFEKALPDLQGAYPMINQQFVLHACEGFSYINREEDTGDPGLRKSKLSYFPDILLKKYRAVQSDVVFALSSEKEEIAEIWQKCFGDTKEEITCYFETYFTKQNMLVIHEDGKVAAMASFLPAELSIGEEKSFPARYVYAVATRPEYRKRGYAAKILNYAKEKYRMPLALQPESDALREYYKKFGFMDGFSRISQKGEPAEDEKVVFSEFDAMLFLPDQPEFAGCHLRDCRFVVQ